MPANIKGAPTGSLEKAKRARCEGKGELKSEQKSVKRSNVKPLQARNANIPGPIYSPVPCYPRLQRGGASRSEVLPTYQASQKPVGLTLGTNGGWREWTNSASQERSPTRQGCGGQRDQNKKNLWNNENKDPSNNADHEQWNNENKNPGNDKNKDLWSDENKPCFPSSYSAGGYATGCCQCTNSKAAHEKSLPFYMNFLSAPMFCPFQAMHKCRHISESNWENCHIKNGSDKEKTCFNAGPLKYQNEGNKLIIIRENPAIPSNFSFNFPKC